MKNPIGQLVAVKDGTGWILGMVIRPYKNPFTCSEVYEIEWYFKNDMILRHYPRCFGGDMLKQYLTTYRHKVRAKVYKGTFKEN